MNDLRFVVVNSNLEHAQLLVHELQRRVSFSVYQDTAEKNIWKLMQGGKDDLFVYDRCGRLAYYIPYPLSIMNEEDSLVPSAILATYYRSPCGVTCAKNSSTLEDFLNSQVDSQNVDTEVTEPDQYMTTLDESNFINLNDHNESYTVQRGDFELNARNESEPNSFEDLDYTMYNDTMEDFETSRNMTRRDNTFFNTLFRLFFNEYTTELPVTEETGDTVSFNFSATELPESTTDGMSWNETALNYTERTIVQELKERSPKPNRCAEADTLVCRDWSKKRLLRAHNCCNSVYNEDYQQRVCKNFGRKRCKKLQLILKCCIKTSFVEATTIEPTEETTEAEAPCTTTSTPDDVTQPIADVVCCKQMPIGNICRVGAYLACKDDEYVSDVKEKTPTEGKT